MTELADWGNFYVIVGSSGAALIGIQFVVIALIADMRRRTTADSISAYAALVVAALRLSATAQTAVFVIGAAALGLLLVGIHNAWDTVTHVVVTEGHRDETGAQ